MYTKNKQEIKATVRQLLYGTSIFIGVFAAIGSMGYGFYAWFAELG